MRMQSEQGHWPSSQVPKQSHTSSSQEHSQHSCPQSNSSSAGKGLVSFLYLEHKLHRAQYSCPPSSSVSGSSSSGPTSAGATNEAAAAAGGVWEHTQVCGRESSQFRRQFLFTWPQKHSNAPARSGTWVKSHRGVVCGGQVLVQNGLLLLESCAVHSDGLPATRPITVLVFRRNDDPQAATRLCLIQNKHR